MTSPRIQRLSERIASPGLTTSARRAMVARAATEGNNPFHGLLEFSQAVAIVKDDEIRADLGACLWAQLNTPRVVMGKDLPRYAPIVTAVIFTVDDPSPLFNEFSSGLMPLTGPLDDPMSRIADPLQPSIPPLLLAVPFAGLDFATGCSLNYMLANPTRTEADETYGLLWAQATQSNKASLNTFAYLFLTTREGMTLEQATDTGVTPDTGQRTHEIIDLITTNANALNAKLAGLNMQMVEVCSLSTAVQRGTELRIRKALRDQRYLVGAFNTDTKPLPEDLAYGGTLKEALASFASKHAGQRQAPEETFGKAIFGVVSSADLGNDQMGQCLMLSVHGVPNVAFAVRLPQGISTRMFARWCREEIDPDGRAEQIALPSLVVSKIPKGLDKASLFRDERGEWLELPLLRLGEHKNLFKTAAWSTALKTTQVPLGSPSELVEVPHPRLTLMAVNLEEGAKAHFAPDVARKLLDIASQPGRSYESMRSALGESFPGLILAQTILPHPTDAFIPSGFWAALHFEKAGGVVYRLRETFQEAMEQTGFKSAYPLELLRCPYPDIYMQFARPIELEDGLVLGAYCSEQTHSDEECEDQGLPCGSRSFSMLIVMTYQGGLSPELLSSQFVIKPDDERDLAEMIREGFKRVIEENAVSTARFQNAEREGEKFVNVLMLVFKVLLYVGMKSSRQELRLDRSQLQKKVSEARGAEREKLARKARATYDKIVVGPETPEWSARDRTSARYTKAVWAVQGYFQPVRFGPGRQQVRSHWQPPSFRHRHGLDDDGSPAKPSDYEVK